MSTKKIKVAGYVQKEVYNGNIEYRNFSPNLVGLQPTSNGDTPLFTMGNFSITTNLDPKLNKTYTTSKFSDFYSLEDLNLTVEETNLLLQNNAGVYLNLDKSKLKYYAMFGSLTEYIRVSLEDIIIRWPASLYVTPFSVDNSGSSIISNTFDNYVYDELTNISSFRVNTNLLSNKFNINYLTNGTILDTFNESNDMRNLTVNYGSYVIYLNGVETQIISFTGSTNLDNDFIYFEVIGDVFSGISNTVSYHIKPNKLQNDLFFNSLDDLQSYLLNRKTNPIHQATFNFPIKSEQGILLYVDRTITWPVTDGYNIDYDTGDYISYASQLLDVAFNNDSSVSNLMNRFLVSESITTFDTVPVILHEEFQDNTGQKMNKTLNIYGRSFDEINNFIYGISFAHTVTYNKQDNVPDKFLKDLAKILGWGLISSVLENDLLSTYVSTSESEYTGESVGLTPVEADIELWRRLILNSPWIWKSKGTRKTIEFFLKFIGTPLGLIDFNEHVYVADGPIDVELFTKILDLNNLDTDLSNYPIDTDGYPRFFTDSDEMYFQSKGLWYRQTGGETAVIDISEGNNPHVGPYDGGSSYINQLKTLIPNFSATSITAETIVTGVTNLFTNYSLGEMNDYSGDTFVDVVNIDGTDLSTCYVVTPEILKDPIPSEKTNDCGCPTDETDDALSICIKKGQKQQLNCPEFVYPPKDDNGLYVFQLYQYNQDGSVYGSNGFPTQQSTYFIPRECCTAYNGTPVYGDLELYGDLNSGFACCSTNNCACRVACNWVLNNNPIYLPLNGQNTEPYCEFTTLNGIGTKKVVSSDGGFCPSNWTIAVPNITDPYTGEVGFGCKITQNGINQYSLMQNYFTAKANGGYKEYTCCSFTPQIYLNIVLGIK
jgi:hypothetical protein